MALGIHKQVLILCKSICIGMELVDHRIYLSSTLGGTAKVVAPIYTPSSNVCEFLLLHIFDNALYCQFY